MRTCWIWDQKLLAVGINHYNTGRDSLKEWESIWCQKNPRLRGTTSGWKIKFNLRLNLQAASYKQQAASSRKQKAWQWILYNIGYK